METPLIVAVVLFVAIFFLIHKKKESQQTTNSWHSSNQAKRNPPEKLLDLKTTTVADRQRAYGHGFTAQPRYDAVQAQAEAADDNANLEQLRLGTYPSDKLPVKRPDGTYTYYPNRIIEFSIVGINYRNQRQLRHCVGLFNARLVSEPTNEFDPDAIKVIHESNVHVGYIPRDSTSAFRSLVTIPFDCFAQIWKDDNYHHPTFSGSIYLEIHQNDNS